MAESNGQGSGAEAVHANGKTTYAEKYSLASHFIGGNELDNAPASKVKDFVASHDGHTVITNVSWALQRLARLCFTADVKLTVISLGSDCQQRYRRRQGDPIGAEMGVRDIRR